ncbi:PREDICTED: melanoma antigen preferentially expressed in tumors-like [Elephantulus edwardii]|uniref:melanoma antigen preferentially expressed in tumors-like n=1 Tax=Elephantulus edwardii TaxID=28737 RepID=UPI0003F0CF0D|nr:PREDICTED: melanoma antigen preferentially expressed in tumors-like [Elephantulus edwardii]
MGRQNPSRLVDLAAQSLLEHEAAAMAALQSLPRECFPPLFVLAVARRRCRTVQAMVVAWPFPYLPLGALLEAPQCDQDILKAALNGLDVLLAHDFRPTRWKLQVLDLRSDTYTNFWHVWAGLGDGISASPLRESGAAQPSPERHRVRPSSTGEKKQCSAEPGVLVLLSDLCFTEPSPDELLTFLVKRVEEKKLLPQLCCRRLEFLAELLRFHIVKKIFDKVHLDCMEEVEVSCHLQLDHKAKFTQCLRKMVHLNSLYLGRDFLDHWTHWDATVVTSLFAQFSIVFLHLQHLRHLHIHLTSSLPGQLYQVFRYLEAPLECLYITDSCMTGSDLEYLSRCSSTCRLSSLHLRNVQIVGVAAVFLNILLERISGTLKKLDLSGCGMTDIEFTALLPALGRCSQLDFLRFSGNSLLMDVLESLLLCTLPQNKITMLEVPLPRECCVSCGGMRIIDMRAVQNWLEQLSQVLEDLGLELDCPAQAAFLRRWLVLRAVKSSSFAADFRLILPLSRASTTLTSCPGCPAGPVGVQAPLVLEYQGVPDPPECCMATKDIQEIHTGRLSLGWQPDWAKSCWTRALGQPSTG